MFYISNRRSLCWIKINKYFSNKRSSRWYETWQNVTSWNKDSLFNKFYLLILIEIWEKSSKLPRVKELELQFANIDTLIYWLIKCPLQIYHVLVFLDWFICKNHFINIKFTEILLNYYSSRTTTSKSIRISYSNGYVLMVAFTFNNNLEYFNKVYSFYFKIVISHDILYA